MVTRFVTVHIEVLFSVVALDGRVSSTEVAILTLFVGFP